MEFGRNGFKSLGAPGRVFRRLLEIPPSAPKAPAEHDPAHMPSNGSILLPLCKIITGDGMILFQVKMKNQEAVIREVTHTQSALEKGYKDHGYKSGDHVNIVMLVTTSVAGSSAYASGTFKISDTITADKDVPTITKETISLIPPKEMGKSSINEKQVKRVFFEGDKISVKTNDGSGMAGILSNVSQDVITIKAGPKGKEHLYDIKTQDIREATPLVVKGPNKN